MIGEIDSHYSGVSEILTEEQKRRGLLIQSLQAIQKEHNYLPQEKLEELSKRLGIALSEIYSAATFYKHFYFKPRGRNIVCVCMGTACHVRGASKTLGSLEEQLGLKEGETAKDMSVTLQTVGCVGCCGLAPVVTVNDEVLGEVDNRKVQDIVKTVSSRTMPGG